MAERELHLRVNLGVRRQGEGAGVSLDDEAMAILKAVGQRPAEEPEGRPEGRAFPLLFLLAFEPLAGSCRFDVMSGFEHSRAGETGGEEAASDDAPFTSGKMSNGRLSDEQAFRELRRRQQQRRRLPS